MHTEQREKEEKKKHLLPSHQASRPHHLFQAHPTAKADN